MPKAGNPAIGAIPAGTKRTVDGAEFTLCPSVDQRGAASPEGKPCDIGAVQTGGVSPDAPTVGEVRAGSCPATLPPRGPVTGGTTVCITGTNLTGVTSVEFGKASASVTEASATQVTAVSPACAVGCTAGTAVPVTVRTAKDQSAVSPSATFTYVRGLLADPKGPATAACTPSAPCSLTRALSTAPDGEVVYLNPGAYLGTYTISTSISVEPAPGTTGSYTLDGNKAGTVLTVDKGTTVHIKGVTVTRGQGQGSGGAPGGILNNGSLTLEDMIVRGNAGGAGYGSAGAGGITNNSALTIVRSTVSDNVGGSIPSTSGFGGAGGIASDWGSGIMSVRETVIANNTGGTGAQGGTGGLFTYGVTSLTGSTVSANKSGASTVSSSAVGGIYQVNGLKHTPIKITTSTVSGNVGSGSSPTGGLSGNAVLERSTIAASEGYAVAGYNLHVAGSLIAGRCSVTDWNDGGYNAVADAGCPSGPNRQSGDSIGSLLSELAENGGPTQTRLPKDGSPAIGAVPHSTKVTLNGNEVTLCPSMDQRGYASPKGAACDIGAVQTNAAVTAPRAPRGTTGERSGASNKPDGTATASFGGVTATGSGIGGVTVSAYDKNPVKTKPDNLAVSPAPKFLDVLVSKDSAFTSLKLEFDLSELQTTGEGPSSVYVSYYDEKAQTWRVVQPLQLYSYLTAVTTLTTSTSSPMISELTGTVFAVGLRATGDASPSPAPSRLAVAAGSEVVTAGGRAVLTGVAAPGAPVELLAYSRPSTTYKVIRRITADATGAYTFTIWPQTNTRLLVRSGGQSSESVVVAVRSALSFTATRTDVRTYRFAGKVRPSRPGQLVSVYAQTPSGNVLVGRGRVRADGSWTATHRFTGNGTFPLYAVTGSDLTNLGGRSRTVHTAVR